VDLTVRKSRYRDFPFTSRWAVPGLACELGLPPARNAAQEKTRASVLANAIIAEQMRQGVSYSRREGYYSDGKRYRGGGFTYSTVMASIEELNREELIIDTRVPPGNLGWQSSFVASELLMNAWRGAAEQRLVYSPAREIIWLKNEAGIPVDYSDTRDTQRIRKELAALNEAVAMIDVAVAGAERRGPLLVIDKSYVLPSPGNGMRRIFNHGTFAKGGRAYGWWQSIPKSARIGLTIDGEPTDEADYSCMHAAILYAKAGIRFDGDFYDVDGMDRNHLKRALNIMLNAKSVPTAVGALANEISMNRAHAAKVIDAIQRRHSPIARRFFSGAGLHLMRDESAIMLDAVKHLWGKGIPVLAIHDAAVVPAKFISHAKAQMIESFEGLVGRVNPCIVKVKSESLPHRGDSLPSCHVGARALLYER
jgi:hypothetical protein